MPLLAVSPPLKAPEGYHLPLFIPTDYLQLRCTQLFWHIIPTFRDLGFIYRCLHPSLLRPSSSSLRFSRRMRSPWCPLSRWPSIQAHLAHWFRVHHRLRRSDLSFQPACCRAAHTWFPSIVFPSSIFFDRLTNGAAGQQGNLLQSHGFPQGFSTFWILRYQVYSIELPIKDP